jgi:energy-coupling factor transport system substrate-specific component
MMATILIIAQLALAGIPNIELVSLFIIAYARVIGIKAVFPIAVFVLVEGLIFGFSLWFINYLYVWFILLAIVLLLRKVQNTLIWAMVSAIFGLMFGALCSIPYFFMGGAGAALAYFISGIPFDIAHAAGNFVAALLLLSPTYRILSRILPKMGFVNVSLLETVSKSTVQNVKAA